MNNYMPFIALYVGPAKIFQYAKSFYLLANVIRGIKFSTNPNLFLAITDVGLLMVFRTADC